MGTEPIRLDHALAELIADLQAKDLTVAQVADTLDCSTKTVYALITAGTLAAFRLNGTGGPFRITQAALRDYRTLQANKDPWARTRPLPTPRRTA